jgi:hypothetical protein
MTVVVACNTSDSVVLGADSALTMLSPDNKTRYLDFGNSKKVFSLGLKPLGIAIYGKNYFGGNPIKYYISEFINNESSYLKGKVKIDEVVEKLREYFSPIYEKDIIGRKDKDGKPLRI